VKNHNFKACLILWSFYLVGGIIGFVIGCEILWVLWDGAIQIINWFPEIPYQNVHYSLRIIFGVVFWMLGLCLGLAAFACWLRGIYVWAKKNC
jgi:hypothetical protein